MTPTAKQTADCRELIETYVAEARQFKDRGWAPKLLQNAAMTEVSYFFSYQTWPFGKPMLAVVAPAAKRSCDCPLHHDHCWCAIYCTCRPSGSVALTAESPND